jgi:hypothetical protein
VSEKGATTHVVLEGFVTQMCSSSSASTVGWLRSMKIVTLWPAKKT